MNYGRYQVIKEIGKGAMGNVYVAHDPNLDLNVALKVLRRDRVESESFVRRFLAEAKALGRLDRANIVRVFNVDEDSGTVYIAMEYVEGEALSEIMKNKQFSPEEIVKIGANIARTLDYAHQRGIVHRDIKPSNILVRPDGFLKITDFGIAHIQDAQASERTMAGEILGTPAYMSPEQVMGKHIDGRSDLFSLGIILYELCTGTRPFRGDNMHAIFTAVTREEPVHIAELNPAIPTALAHCIMKCLNKDPDRRFQTGTDYADALESSVKEDETVELAASGQVRKHKNIFILAAGLLLLVLTAGGYIFHMKKTEAPPLTFLNVESVPSASRIFIDGMFKGNTPLRIELPAGKHEVRLTLPDHYDWEAQIQLKEKEETPLFVRLIPIN